MGLFSSSALKWMQYEWMHYWICTLPGQAQMDVLPSLSYVSYVCVWVRSFEIIDWDYIFHDWSGGIIDPNLQLASRSTEIHHSDSCTCLWVKIRKVRRPNLISPRWSGPPSYSVWLGRQRRCWRALRAVEMRGDHWGKSPWPSSWCVCPGWPACYSFVWHWPRWGNIFVHRTPGFSSISAEMLLRSRQFWLTTVVLVWGYFVRNFRVGIHLYMLNHAPKNTASRRNLRLIQAAPFRRVQAFRDEVHGRPFTHHYKRFQGHINTTPSWAVNEGSCLRWCAASRRPKEAPGLSGYPVNNLPSNPFQYYIG